MKTRVIQDEPEPKPADAPEPEPAADQEIRDSTGVGERHIPEQDANGSKP
jgi:hypothetical protein